MLIFDIETDGLYPSKVHSICTLDYFTLEKRSFCDQEGHPSIREGIEYLQQFKTICGHNIISYDVPAIERIYNIVLKPQKLDTYLLAQMARHNILAWDLGARYTIPKELLGSHSLKAYGYRLGCHKGEFNGPWDSWTPEMQKYCEQDVEVTYRLYRNLDKFIGNELPIDAIKMEMNFAHIMQIQETNGVPFNIGAAIELRDPLLKRHEEVKQELITIVPPKITQLKTKTKEEPFNPGSRQQIMKFLEVKYGWVPEKTTKNGNPSLNEEVLESMVYPEAKLFLEFFQTQKLLGMLSEGDKSWLKFVKNGRLHGRVNTLGAVTGRCTHCIEENQRVMTYNGYKKIKDIEPGDLVYCFDDTGKIRIRPVLEKIYQGVNPVYKMNWVKNKDSKTGSLVCTEEHKIYLNDGSWVRLKDLRDGALLRHVTRTVNDGRYTLCYSGRNRTRQSRVIKEEVFGVTDRSVHIHHKDHNKLNDSLSNLEVLSATDHARHHHAGDKFTYTKLEILKMLARAKGRPTKVPMDFETYKKYCKKFGISLSKLLTRYRQGDRRYITKADIIEAYNENPTPYAMGLKLGVHWTKKRINKLIDSHGLILNHWVQGVEYYGEAHTYDLHIKEFHNFICEEISVSNSNPNLAQIPSTRSFMGKEVRSLFYAPEDYVMVGADASGLELRCLAHYLFKYDYGEYADEILKGDIHTKNQHAAGLKTRDQAKTFIYGMCYGAGDQKLGSIVMPEGTPEEQIPLGYRLKSRFFEAVPAYREVLKDVKKEARETSAIRGIDGRRLPVRSQHSALNVLLQNAGAMVMKRAYVIAWPELKKLGLDARPALQVHDEVQMIVRAGQHEQVGKLLVESITKAGEYYDFKCPLAGEYKFGKSWMETH